MPQKTEKPSSSGWLGREMRAARRRQMQENMADIRAARRANAQREEAKARGETVAQPMQQQRRYSEGSEPTVATRYPDADSMSRQAMVDYLKAHGQFVPPKIKDETLRRKVIEVRDGVSKEQA
jgi:glutamate/tyrosine decarboxylase-like PLP-dependent enzyme